ncbi:tetraacyldisaccharide 4'-kinase [Qingshengfaniella alkalisoli]|uniref:Tetraacyldisaccharide 4'-kinase n=1 Tax=Qingshengfaniella alkalisoli TaxID=2599296 RepID=A0A5B8I8S6_9RHOB|nr:tetraacyldisaccharide 4'-kinase [Qingshengfaniella alkalisoli]QDY70189.1 tetraacyldisaccharide 4'-kinase [Qingshengfaniella alkalisoli]
MRPPRFWNRPPGRPALASRLLSPLAALYAWGTARRAGIVGQSAPVPVICVGNLNAGGTGKTPVVISLTQRLIANGYNPAVVTRGYGGNIEGPTKVDPNRHSAEQTGDEALLHAAFTATWIAKDRAAGVAAAVAEGADSILLDDGFQNPSVTKDLSIVVVDAATGFGNGRVLPAGPLREPVGPGLARADLLLSVGEADDQATFQTRWGDQVTCPSIQARLEPLQMGMDWHGLRVLAFAGIGRPEKFFNTLKSQGADIVDAVALGDHQPLAPALLSRLEQQAKAKGLQLVTTEKDQVRMPPGFRHKVLTLPVRLEPESWTEIDHELARIGLGGPES